MNTNAAPRLTNVRASQLRMGDVIVSATGRRSRVTSAPIRAFDADMAVVAVTVYTDRAVMNFGGMEGVFVA